MKILTLNCTYHDGSTGKLINDIRNKLSEYEFVECYESGPKPSNPSMYLIGSHFEQLFYYVLARITGLKYSTGYCTTRRLIRFIKKTSPDVIHLHCPNAYTVNIPKVLCFLKKSGIPAVITNHAEFYYTGNCPHAYECEKYKTGCGNCNYVFDKKRKFLLDRTAYEWKLMKSAFSNFSNIMMVCVSEWAKNRLESSPITSGLPVVIIHNGVNTSVFRPKSLDGFSLPFEIRGKIILSVTASFSIAEDDPKGGIFFVRLAKSMPEDTFIVCGTSLLDDKQEIPINLHVIGRVDSQDELADYYSAADLTVMTGKRETFGMACAESMCCGTPVVGFKAGGPESVSLPEYSCFVEHGDLKSLCGCVSEWKGRKYVFSEKLAEIAKSTYSSDTMAAKYRDVYENVVSTRSR